MRKRPWSVKALVSMRIRPALTSPYFYAGILFRFYRKIMMKDIYSFVVHTINIFIEGNENTSNKCEARVNICKLSLHEMKLFRVVTEKRVYFLFYFIALLTS